jgi:succinyl-diaminopimelate desuccinylase
MTELSNGPVGLAQALICCASVTPLEAGALDVLERALAQGGFRCHRLLFEEEGTPAVDNLYARIGSGYPHLCFAGHSDVVPPGEAGQWSHPPFAGEIEDGVLYGRGASDMKGAIAAFAAAALDFAKSKGSDLPGSISLLITGDEEGPAINGTRKVLDWMAANNEQPDHALVGEPTNTMQLGQAIKIGRRGSLNGRLKVSGVQGHVAYPQLAKNPAKGLIAVLAKYYEAPLDFGTAYFSPSNFEVTSIDVGNVATNVIPARAEAQFNIRFNDRHSAESLQAQLWDQAAKMLANSGLEFELFFEPPSHAFLTEPGPLDGVLSEAVRDVTGLTPSLATDGGTSDARFIKAFCPVVEFGLLTATIHKIDEQVALADLEQLTAIYRRFLDLYFDAFGIIELV